MTNDELDRLTALANAATPGPWRHQTAANADAPDDYGAVKAGGYLVVEDAPDSDCAFIAAARDAVPALVAEVKRLRGLVREAYDAGYHWGHNDWRTQYEPVRRWEESDVRNKLDGAA